MRTVELREVTGRPFIVFCLKCNTELWAGDVDAPQGTHYPVFADLKGEAFKAYYCAQCAEWLRNSKEA